MVASYWSRWACNGQVADLAELVLPNVLAEGYDLLTSRKGRQTFDRGGILKEIGWSLNGGRWEHAPLNLTVTYSCSPTRTIANFYWRLSSRPLPATPKEQTRFEAYLQEQMNRIIARLNEQMAYAGVEEDSEAADEGASLQACWDYGRDFPQDLSFSALMARPDRGDAPAVSTLKTATQQPHVRSDDLWADNIPHCDVCGSPAVPIPGTSNRHYCLLCSHHLPHIAVS